jgi:RHS repeat-associated protein
VTAKYQYRAFGLSAAGDLPIDPQTNFNGFGKKQYYLDSEIELYLLGGGGGGGLDTPGGQANQGRYYDPAVAKFTSEDPIGLGGGDYNLYRYVRNDPLNRVDPTGHGDGESGEYVRIRRPADDDAARIKFLRNMTIQALGQTSLQSIPPDKWIAFYEQNRESGFAQEVDHTVATILAHPELLVSVLTTASSTRRRSRSTCCRHHQGETADGERTAGPEAGAVLAGDVAAAQR